MIILFNPKDTVDSNYDRDNMHVVTVLDILTSELVTFRINRWSEVGKNIFLWKEKDKELFVSLSTPVKPVQGGKVIYRKPKFTPEKKLEPIKKMYPEYFL